MFGKYTKTIMAVGGFFATLGTALADGDLSGGEIGAIAAAAATVAAVYQARNKVT